ncbi:MAG: alginate export family protein, partial [Nitrospinales bacterium]
MSWSVYIKSQLTRPLANFAKWAKNILWLFLVFGIPLGGVSGPAQVAALVENHNIDKPEKLSQQTFPAAKKATLKNEDKLDSRKIKRSKSKKKRKKKRKKNRRAFDFGTPPKAKNKLTPTLSYGGRLGLEYQLEQNFDLISSKADDLRITQPSLSLAFSYVPFDILTFFANIQSTGRIADDDRHRKEDQIQLTFKQVFVSFDTFIEGLNIKVGRQRIKDDRQWVYDDELNAVRVNYEFSRYGLDVSISQPSRRDLLNNERVQDAVNFTAFGRAMWHRDHSIAIYTFVRENEPASKDDPIFFGLQMRGEPIKDTEYWVDFANVRGRNGPLKIRGYGFDVGFTSVFDVSLKPSFTFGWAYGSGDNNLSDGNDLNFRQTGLQDNNAAFNGVTRIQYYGEVVDPELSNLSILTGGIGIRPIKEASFDIVYHYYHQNKLSRKIRDFETSEKPNGLSSRLGSEVDFIMGYRNRKSGLTSSLIV